MKLSLVVEIENQKLKQNQSSRLSKWFTITLWSSLIKAWRFVADNYTSILHKTGLISQTKYIIRTFHKKQLSKANFHFTTMFK